MRFYPDWSLYNLHRSLGGESHLTSPKHTRFRLTAIAVVYLENVTVSCLFTTFPSRTAARLPMATGDIRKDIRRPRFSFFRFNCQTACLLIAQTRQLGRVLTVLLTEELACVHPRGSRRPKERAPDACAAVRGRVYSCCCRCLSTANVKIFSLNANHARFRLSPLKFSALQTGWTPPTGHVPRSPGNFFVRCKIFVVPSRLCWPESHAARGAQSCIFLGPGIRRERCPAMHNCRKSRDNCLICAASQCDPPR